MTPELGHLFSCQGGVARSGQWPVFVGISFLPLSFRVNFFVFVSVTRARVTWNRSWNQRDGRSKPGRDR